MGAGAVAASGLITLIRTIPTIVAALASGLKDVRAQRDGAAPQTSRLDRDIPMKFVSDRLCRHFGDDVGAVDVQAHTWSNDRLVCESCGCAVRTCVRFFVRDSFMPHLRVDRHVIESGEWHDHRDLDGDLRDVPGGRLDRRGVCRSGDHYWRRGRNRRGQCWRTSQDLKTGYLVGATPVRQQIG